jgi:hypothetical protein
LSFIFVAVRLGFFDLTFYCLAFPSFGHDGILQPFPDSAAVFLLRVPAEKPKIRRRV